MLWKERLQSDSASSLPSEQSLVSPYWLLLRTAQPSLPALAVFVYICDCIDSYHTGSHAGLPAAEPRHGCRDRHLWWCKGGRARLGDVGMRGTMVDVVRAAKQNTTRTRHVQNTDDAQRLSQLFISQLFTYKTFWSISYLQGFCS